MDPLLHHLQTFIAFRSVAPDAAEKRRCLDWIRTQFLSASPHPVQEGEVDGCPYVYLRHPSPAMLWFGHTDVVPGRPDQFALRIEGDKAYGRGVKDMKGADLTFLLAYAEACAAGHVPPVSVLLTSDEEIGGAAPATLISSGLFDGVPVAFTPDTGEQPQIVTELKGAVWMRVRRTGTAGHAASPWESDNPVPQLLRDILPVLDAFPPGTKDDWRTTVTVTELQGSDAMNRIPSEASCILDVRFPSSEFSSPEQAFAAIRKRFPQECTTEILISGNPSRIDPQHPTVLQLRRIAQEVIGADVHVGREHGTSDVRHFTAYGIPAFLYGPLGGDLHGEQEWVSVPSLHHHVEMNRRWLRELRG